ncbi:sensor histidine kinase [Saccharomonospora iraqiensis]|uniref:sensor histidine kinase n=1 Tax=Saccharomonospora iraqiensis TaxID=52698 RepID=UPI003899F586
MSPDRAPEPTPPPRGPVRRLVDQLVGTDPDTQRRPAVPGWVADITFVVVALLDVWLVVPDEAPPYTVWLSAASCAALLLRRPLPFLALVLAVPGFFAGWAQLAVMFALGSLATRKQCHWHVWVGAALVWCCRFVLWPWSEMLALSWRMHVLDAIYGVIVAGMPVAIGLLIGARTELATRLAELAASRDRERQLHAQAVRAEERARLAREMHDGVSHDITLIAMQASALSAASADDETRRTAATIRTLSTRTLEELRTLLGVLRSDAEDGPSPDLRDLDDLVRNAGVPVRLTADDLPDTLSAQVSAAAYRTVQECLTNVRKHAPGATAHVDVTTSSEQVRVEVRNGAPCAPADSPLPSGGGYGLAGLAERARLLGGDVDTGTTPDGGFRVRAHYPVT